MLRWVRYVAWAGVAVLSFLLLATSAGWLVTDGPLGRRPVATGPASLGIGGPFSLTDHRGRRVTERDYAGRPSAVFFGFTYCPDVCPTTLSDMDRWIEALGPDADRVNWLFVSVDSGRDNPRTMADYLANFDARIVGLSGTEGEVASAARSFRVFYRRVPIDGGYTMDHSASVLLLDAGGSFAGTIDHKEGAEVALQKLRLLVGSRG